MNAQRAVRQQAALRCWRAVVKSDRMLVLTNMDPTDFVDRLRVRRIGHGDK